MILGKSLLNHKEKYFIVNHGIREALFNMNMGDLSQVLKNIVYFELLKRRYTVNIGIIGKNEIDFVAVKGKSVNYLLSSEKTIKREFGNLLKIKYIHPKYVISMDDMDISHDGIKHLNIIDFLLNGLD